MSELDSIWCAIVYEETSRNWGIYAAYKKELSYSTLAACCQWKCKLLDLWIFLRRSQDPRFLWYPWHFRCCLKKVKTKNKGKEKRRKEEKNKRLVICFWVNLWPLLYTITYIFKMLFKYNFGNWHLLNAFY